MHLVGRKKALEDLNESNKGLVNIGDVEDSIFLEEMSSIRESSVNRVSWLISTSVFTTDSLKGMSS